MAHKMRFMQEVKPGTWVIQCRLCPKRKSKRVYDSAAECHAYWTEHVSTTLHRDLDSPEGRARRVEWERSERKFDAIFRDA